jgi:hypothetical protein
LAVLWVAPALYALASKRPRLRWVVDKVLPYGVAALVVLDIVPDSFAVVGWWALAVAAFGLLVPTLVERTWRGQAETIHWIPLVVGVVGLALHASLDGASFAASGVGEAEALHLLPVVVVVHRFFEGLFLWTTLKERGSVRAAVAVLTFDTVFTVSGFVAADVMMAHLEDHAVFALFQALVGGSILHLLVHSHVPGAHVHGPGCGHDGGHAHSHTHSHADGHAGHDCESGHG